MKLKSKTIHISMVAIILLWAVVTDAWGYSDIFLGKFGNGWGSYIYGFISRGIWVIPAIVLIRKYEDSISIKW